MLQQKPCSRNMEIPGGRGGVIKDPLGTEIPKGLGDANQKTFRGRKAKFCLEAKCRGGILIARTYIK